MKNEWKTELLNEMRDISKGSNDWHSSREISEKMNVSIYTVRYRLNELQNEGFVMSLRSGAGKRGKICWKLKNI